MNILIVDDDKVSRSILQLKIEKWGHEPTVASDGHEALYFITDSTVHFDIIILDWEMPGISGIDLCKRIRETTNIKSVPPYVIMLTSHDSPSHVQEALDAGADDFITKASSSVVFRARLGVGFRTVALHKRLQQAITSMEYKANHDNLTRLLNRTAILERFPAEISRSARSGQYLSVGVIDIDYFKQFNDTYGHNLGDKVIVAVSNVLRNTFRAYDLVGRWGGEEFIIIAPCNSCADITDVYNRLLSNIRNHIVTVGGMDHKITVSAGVTVAETRELILLDDVVKEADVALYKAKNNGRDCFELTCHAHDKISNSENKGE